MATLLAEMMFRNYNSSLLRQHRVKESFFSIHEYTSATLGRVLTNYVALLWVEYGQPWLNMSWYNGPAAEQKLVRLPII